LAFTRSFFAVCGSLPGITTEDSTVHVIGFTHLQRDPGVGDSDSFVNGM